MASFGSVGTPQAQQGGGTSSCQGRGTLAVFPLFPPGTWDTVLLGNGMMKGVFDSGVVADWLSRPL